MSILNPDAIHMSVPDYRLDNVIAVYSGTIALGAPGVGSVTEATDTFNHGFGDSVYPVGVFNVDGSAQFNDFGVEIPNTAPPFPQFQSQGCVAVCTTTQLQVTAYNWYDTAHSSGAAHTISYRVYVLAKNTMAQPITPQSTNQILQYDSSYNYQKILMQGTINLTVPNGSTGSVSVVHGLGYVPKVRAFRFNSGGFSTCVPLNSPGTPTIPSYIQIVPRISTTSLTLFADCSFGVGGVNANIDYRIYLDS